MVRANLVVLATCVAHAVQQLATYNYDQSTYYSTSLSICIMYLYYYLNLNI